MILKASKIVTKLQGILKDLIQNSVGEITNVTKQNKNLIDKNFNFRKNA